VLSCDLSTITIHISDCRQFSDIYIPQGSVATYLRCGEIFKYDFVANLLLSLSVKVFWKSVNICESYRQDFSVSFFDSQCIYCVFYIAIIEDLTIAVHFSEGNNFKNCLFPLGDTRPLIRDSFSPSNFTTQTASRSVHPFSYDLQTHIKTQNPRYVCSTRPQQF